MAQDINNVTIVGRLTKDSELKYTNSGTAIAVMSIAVNRSKKDGDQWVEEANFFDISLWGRRGETLNQYLLKGQQIAVTGELRQERWEKDGQNRSKVLINASNIQLLGGKKSEDTGNNNNYNSYSNNGNQGNNLNNQYPNSQFNGRPGGNNNSRFNSDDIPI